MKDNTLHLFFGREPSEDFLEAIKQIKELKENEVFGIIDNLFKWYPKNIDEEWKKWIEKEKLNDEEKKKIEDTIAVFLPLIKEFTVGHIDEKELKEDFEKISLSENYINYFIKKLKSAKDFCEKTIIQGLPYVNSINSVDWRIDKHNSGQDFEKNICVLEFNYSSFDKRKVVQFNLTLDGLRYLIANLKRIEKRLCAMNQ